MSLPTPYYEDKASGITIYCADSQKLGIQASIILSDPPYGIDYQSAWRIDWQRKEKIHGDDEFPKWIFDNPPPVATMLCCRWDNPYKLPKPKSFIVWDKMRHSMGDLGHGRGPTTNLPAGR